jgi:hypothetical protein
LGIFDRFTSPLWNSISALDEPRQIAAAWLITGYGASRKTVYEQLVAPLAHDRVIGSALAASPELQERLVDEAMIALLKSCSIPAEDPYGKLPAPIVQNLPEVWGMFALADSNHRSNREGPETLKSSSYSSDSKEALFQLLSTWTFSLKMSAPTLLLMQREGWLRTAWIELSSSLILGFLTGFSRIPAEVLMKKAKSEAANVPEHRMAQTRYMIESLSKSPLF